MPYMKIDIPYYIRQVLREQRKVYVPEVGTFNLSQVPARISDDKSRIHPPTLDIRFDDGVSNDNSLKRYIQDTDKFSNKKINSAISDYSQLVYNNLINTKINEIEGLGSLVRNEELDKVTFEPTLNLFTKEYKNFKSLPIHPVDRIKEETAVDHVVNTHDQVVRAESKYRWLTPIIAGILIAAMVIFFKKCSEKDSMLYYNPDESSEDIKENGTNGAVDTFFDESNSNSDVSLDAKYKEVNEMLDGTQGIDENEDSESKLDEELDELIDNSNLNRDEIADVQIKSIEEKEPQISAIVEEVDEEPKSKYEAIIPKSGNCIIILASLKKASNITRMISLIERDGKKAYTSQYKGKTRVGFIFDCTDKDLDVYLTDIRKRLSSKAWYLDPTIAIPYK